MRRRSLGLALASAIALVACGDDDGAETTQPVTGDEAVDVQATARPDVTPIELPSAPTASEPLDPSPAIGVHRDAVTLDRDMLRLPLEDGRVPPSSLEDGRIAPLREVLANLRFAAGGLPGRFHSSLLLHADRAARWDTVRAATAAASAEGFVEMKVVALAGGEDGTRRQMRVRVERDDTEPHLRAHLDADGIALRAPGLGAAFEGSCGEALDGPLRLERTGVEWDWNDLEGCQRKALAEIVAETPAAGVTAEASVRWGRVVHLLDRLRALRDDPDRLALLLE